MKTTAILIAVAMMAMAAPTQAVEEIDNRAFFENITQQAYEEFKQSKQYMIRENTDFAFPTSLDFEAEGWDAVFAALEARAGDRDMAKLFENGEETDTFPQAGGYLELFELAISSANECPDTSGTVANPAPGNMPWSYGVPEYIGATSSSASTLGIGLFTDYETGKAFTYAADVTYGGVSDFYCFSFDFFGIFITYNWPWFTGAVAETVSI